jgi:hypothetical protein
MRYGRWQSSTFGRRSSALDERLYQIVLTDDCQPTTDD